MRYPESKRSNLRYGIDIYTAECYDASMNIVMIEVAFLMSSFLDATGAEERKRKGKDAERGDVLSVESWACS